MDPPVLREKKLGERKLKSVSFCHGGRRADPRTQRGERIILYQALQAPPTAATRRLPAKTARNSVVRCQQQQLFRREQSDMSSQGLPTTVEPTLSKANSQTLPSSASSSFPMMLAPTPGQSTSGSSGSAAQYTPMMRLSTMAYFMSASMLVQFTTKAVFTTYGFNFPLTVALLQMTFISVTTYLVSRPTISLSLFKSLMPLATVNVLNVTFGLVGTGGLNVPMFIALRRFTLLFTILLERFWLKKQHDWPTLSAMGVMIGGALIAAATDLTYNPRGYAAVLCNDVLTALYLIMVKNTNKGLTTTRMLFYNATMSIPMLLVAGMMTNELPLLRSAPQLQSGEFLFVLFLASALGLSINHSTFLCTRVNEPLMTSTCGNIKNGAMTIIGAIAFPDFIFEPMNALGLGMSMTGAIFYATRSALRARGNSRAKESLIGSLPVIGKDRLRKLSGTSGSLSDLASLLGSERDKNGPSGPSGTGGGRGGG
jgi:solute carrier family 35 protein